MAFSIPEVLCISGTGYDRSEIPTATPTFSTMPDSMVALVTSSEVRRLSSFKMADSGPEVPIVGGHLEFQFDASVGSGVTTAHADPAMQGGP